MGGQAFRKLLSLATFPRIPTTLYQPIKSHLLTQLKPHFEHVTVPHECPEKNDHGDVDFVVAGLVNTSVNTSMTEPDYDNAGPAGERSSSTIWASDICRSIGATKSVSNLGKHGSGAYHYAVPLSILKTSATNGSTLSEEDNETNSARSVDENNPLSPQNGDEYLQVDMLVCRDKDEHDRYVFYNSYGDLGTIITRLSNCAGVSFGYKGLSIALPDLVPTFSPNIILSTSIPTVMSFLDLDLERWHTGFVTQSSAFEWVASSRFYDPHRIAIRESRVGVKGAARAAAKKQDGQPNRVMYQNWLKWNEDLKPAAKPMKNTREKVLKRARTVDDLDVGVWQVLENFGKREEYEDMVRVNRERTDRIQERLERLARM